VFDVVLSLGKRGQYKVWVVKNGFSKKKLFFPSYKAALSVASRYNFTSLFDSVKGEVYTKKGRKKRKKR